VAASRRGVVGREANASDVQTAQASKEMVAAPFRASIREKMGKELSCCLVGPICHWHKKRENGEGWTSDASLGGSGWLASRA
jgi:hypothetical protein